MAILASYWAATNNNQELPLVKEITKALSIFANTERENLLGAIAGLMPVIARLGGERAVRKTAQAIIDTGKWWP